MPARVFTNRSYSNNSYQNYSSDYEYHNTYRPNRQYYGPRNNHNSTQFEHRPYNNRPNNQGYRRPAYHQQRQTHNQYRSNDNRPTRSDNADFKVLVQQFNKYLRVEHHSKNWIKLPASINKLLDAALDNIHLAYDNATLQGKFSALKHKLKSDLLYTANTHLNSCLDESKAILNNVDSKDCRWAATVARGQFSRGARGKADPLTINRWLEEALAGVQTPAGPIIHGDPASVIRDNPTPTGTPGPGAHLPLPRAGGAPSSALKRPRHLSEDSPEYPISINNRFEIMSHMSGDQGEDDLDDEGAEPHLPDGVDGTPKPSSAPHTKPTKKAKLSSNRKLFYTNTGNFELLLADTQASETVIENTTEPAEASDSEDTFINTAEILVSIQHGLREVHKYQPNQQAKLDNWRIRTSTAPKALIIADSQFRHASGAHFDTELHVFPGAKLKNAAQLVINLDNRGLSNLTDIIYAVGINNRASNPKDVANQLIALTNAAAAKGLRSHFLGVAIPPGLPPAERELLSNLNLAAERLFGPHYIKELPTKDVITMGDFFHYSLATITKINDTVTNYFVEVIEEEPLV